MSAPEWNGTLLSAVLKLRPKAPATIAANLGRATHAWLLDQVRTADPALAGELHKGSGPRPFTVSNLWELAREREPEAILSPNQTYTLRVTSFSPALSALLRQRLVAQPPETVPLAGAPLRIVGTTTDPASHPWAAEATFEGLVQRHTLAANPPRAVGLRFASPTAFRITGRKWALPLPLPALVFGGLLDRWNAHAPIQVHPDVRRFAEECLDISSYRLQTRRVRFGPEGQHGTLTGFQGLCRYYIQVQDRYWMGLIHLLAAFSLYAGIGLRTTQGLGQARKR